ncbi:hypothetical protein F8237_09685 [Bradyrhizobium betae]|uniref:Uncharacterized protein n=1 Tax=Bradyrhizobium betae TaxID=244734 RepID=A0A5P6P354_9BRAD|nr:hypothetical protein F8237_09685 [Bradyrhizobium betae]
MRGEPPRPTRYDDSGGRTTANRRWLECESILGAHPPLEGEGRSRGAQAGWDDLSSRAPLEVERPPPHPVSHFAALNVGRPSPSRGG